MLSEDEVKLLANNMALASALTRLKHYLDFGSEVEHALAKDVVTTIEQVRQGVIDNFSVTSEREQ